MPRFRSGSASDAPRSPSAIGSLLEDVLSPAHFFVGGATHLEWEHIVSEVVPWEVFQGRLLVPAHSRQRRAFETWNVYLLEDGGRSAEPLLSVKLAADANEVNIVRAIHCYAWEGYNAGGNVILSRETRQWTRELVATIPLTPSASLDQLRDEVIGQLFYAVVGTSRLPLTSLEAPLPCFSLGRLAYCYRANAAESGPARSCQELVERFLVPELSWLEKVKLLETLLHAASADELKPALELFVERWRDIGHDGHDFLNLLRSLFNEVSLSPYADLAERTLAVLHLLEQRGEVTSADVLDLIAHLLRQLGRHLTAYDLVVFHHRGANYPDALLLDTLLKAYLDIVERRPALVMAEANETDVERKRQRLRRRALRQAWLIRHRYEGHPVPDAPTSQGESLRVLPATHPRVPEEQILQPARRVRRLYADDRLEDRLTDTARAALRLSMTDLHESLELRELGTALFLDRPFGMGKGPVEPDRTLLLSHIAFSRSIAEARLRFLTEKLQLIDPAEGEVLRQRLHGELEVKGVPMSGVRTVARPGTVSLGDARMTADDFLLLRSTRRSVSDLLAHYDFQPLAEHLSLDWFSPERSVLILGEPGKEGRVTVTLHDADQVPRLELSFDPRAGYVLRSGTEYPADGLRVQGLHGQPVILQSRDR